MSTKEKNITAMFSELNSILNDCNKTLSDNVELKKELAWYKDYADGLVEHKDMVCLPVDLKNLRESNLKLTLANEELKKLLMNNWYTHKQDTTYNGAYNQGLDTAINLVKECSCSSCIETIICGLENSKKNNSQVNDP